MQTYKVKLNSVERVKRFVEVISNVEGESELIHQEHIINAKSILGIFSLDLSQTLQLRMENDTLPRELEVFLV